MAISSFLRQRATLLRSLKIESPDHDNNEWQVISENIPCRLEQIVSSQEKTALGLDIKTEAVAYLPSEIELLPTKLNTVGDHLIINSQLYEVVKYRIRSGSTMCLKIVELRLLEDCQ